MDVGSELTTSCGDLAAGLTAQNPRTRGSISAMLPHRVWLAVSDSVGGSKLDLENVQVHPLHTVAYTRCETLFRS